MERVVERVVQRQIGKKKKLKTEGHPQVLHIKSRFSCLAKGKCKGLCYTVMLTPIPMKQSIVNSSKPEK